MKCRTTKHNISVSLTDRVQLDMRELSFLRMMAQHCTSTQMAGGAAACERLEALLQGMGVPNLEPGPVYDIFEES